MRKLLCACGCGDRVTQKVERRHINALAPALLASEVLVTNQRLKTHKKRSQAIPFPTPFPQQLTMQNISQIDVILIWIMEDHLVLPTMMMISHSIPLQ